MIFQKKGLNNSQLLTKSLFISICICQFLIILLLINQIRQKQIRISVNPIDKSDIFINPDSNLKNFYEPKANHIIHDIAYWLDGTLGTVTINSDNLNERFNYSVSKEPNTFRILTLGDSFTYGLHVDTSQNYPEQLEDMLNNIQNCAQKKKYEVINFGLSGYDIEYSLHRFNVRGRKYQPDLILWLLKYDDFDLIADYVNHFATKKNKKTKNVQERVFFNNDGSIKDLAVEEAKKNLYKKIDLKKIIDYQTEKLYSIKQTYDNDILVFTFENESIKYKEILKNFANNTPKTFYITIPSLNKSTELFPDKHPTDKGYSSIANYLFNYLKSKNIIPCS